MKQSIHERKASNGGESFPDLHMSENKYQGYIRNLKIRVGNANDLLKYVIIWTEKRGGRIKEWIGWDGAP